MSGDSRKESEDGLSASDARFVAAKLIPEHWIAHEIAAACPANISAERHRVAESIGGARKQLIAHHDIGQAGIADCCRTDERGAQRWTFKRCGKRRIVVAFPDRTVIQRGPCLAAPGPEALRPCRGHRTEIVIYVSEDDLRTQIFDVSNRQFDLLLLVDRHVIEDWNVRTIGTTAQPVNVFGLEPNRSMWWPSANPHWMSATPPNALVLDVRRGVSSHSFVGSTPSGLIIRSHFVPQALSDLSAMRGGATPSPMSIWIYSPV